MLEFYLLSDDAKKAIATYTINDNWDLFDTRMGTEMRECPVCHLSDKGCIGHYGLLDLGTSVVHPMFSKKDKPMLMRYILVPKLRLTGDLEWSDEVSALYKQLVNVVRKSGNTSKINSILKRLYGSEHSSGIINMLSGKDGIFRKICYGKRINGSARSVITGDTCIDIDEVLIPKVIANNLFLKCVVSDSTSEYYISKDIPLNKYNCYPGLRCIRKIKNGDLVFMNRQPTLSYKSLLVFRARIRTDDIKTIGIHPNVTSTFGADFDGDEMNIFLFPYSEDVERCRIINHPECIKNIQDSVTAKYVLGQDATYEDLDKYGLTISLDDILRGRYDPGTGLYDIVESGSKGNKKNVEQIMFKVGEQYVSGDKIGKCKSSYITGLNPNEFFIHQKSSREGVISTGVNTSETGYTNRKGCRMMADIISISNDKYTIIKDDYGIIDIKKNE